MQARIPLDPGGSAPRSSAGSPRNPCALGIRPPSPQRAPSWPFPGAPSGGALSSRARHARRRRLRTASWRARMPRRSLACVASLRRRSRSTRRRGSTRGPQRGIRGSRRRHQGAARREVASWRPIPSLMPGQACPERRLGRVSPARPKCCDGAHLVHVGGRVCVQHVCVCVCVRGRWVPTLHRIPCLEPVLRTRAGRSSASPSAPCARP